MVATRDFSGLESSPWALARAAAMAPMVSLERCMVRLRLHYLEADRAGFGALGAQAMPGGLFGILGHQLLQVGLGGPMLLVGRAGPPVSGRKFRPGVRCTHVDAPDPSQPRARRLDEKKRRCPATLDAVPE